MLDDGSPAGEDKPDFKPQPAKAKCIHLGERLTAEEGKQYNLELIELGVKCNACGGKRSEYHCSLHKFTNAGKCHKCPDKVLPNG